MQKKSYIVGQIKAANWQVVQNLMVQKYYPEKYLVPKK